MKSIFLVLSLIIVSGCSSFTIPPYEAILKNVSNEEIDKAHIIFGNVTFPGGVIPPDIEKSVVNPKVPIPEIARVEWVAADGTYYNRKVEVKNRLPKIYPEEMYRIYMLVSASNVEVVVKTHRFYSITE